MQEQTFSRLRQVFIDGHGFARTKEIQAAGLHNVYLNELLATGQIERIKRGLYRWVDDTVEPSLQLVEVGLAVPKGIICLQYALAYHGLTTLRPWEITMAVPRNYRVVLPDYPPIKLYYFKDDVYRAGVQTVKTSRGSFKIYNKEKTLCDCMYYRKQIGIEGVKEGLTEYLRGAGRNLELLQEYARICRVGKLLNTWLEVLR